MKQRLTRLGDELHDDDTVVVRGGTLDTETLRRDAQRNNAVYGVFGVSVFAVRDITLEELIQQPPIIRFEQAHADERRRDSGGGPKTGTDRPQPAAL